MEAARGTREGEAAAGAAAAARRGAPGRPALGQPLQQAEQAQDERQDHGVEAETGSPGAWQQVLPHAGEPVGQCGEGVGHVKEFNWHVGGWQGKFSGRKTLLFVNKKKQKDFIRWGGVVTAARWIAAGAIQRATVEDRRKEKKFFASFFQKRSASFP
jgi:hypothetical protein